MNLHPTDDSAFDRAARAAHAHALEHLSPRVRAQLAQRRRLALAGAASRPSRRLLPWAATATAGIAVALLLQLRPPGTATPAGDGPSSMAAASVESAPRLAVVDADAPVAHLSEDPDFYLWLGENPAGKE